MGKQLKLQHELRLNINVTKAISTQRDPDSLKRNKLNLNLKPIIVPKKSSLIQLPTKSISAADEDKEAVIDLA